MEFSFFALIMSIIFFNSYVLMVFFLRKNNKFIISFSISSMLILVILSICRVIFNFELKNSIHIDSKIIYPRIVDILRTPTYLGSNITSSKILLIVWILGSCFMFLRSFYLYTTFKKSLCNISKLKLKKDLHVLEGIANELNINENIEIYRSNEVIVPFVINFFNYEIYLPNIHISDNDMKNILLHEINHIVGKDNLKKILMLIIKIIFWWNPLVYILNKDVNHILEIQCDLRTTTHMTKEHRIKYLESIINMIKNTKNKTSTIPVINNSLQTSNLYNNSDDRMKQRFTLVIDYFKNDRTLKINTVIFFIITISLFVFSYLLIIKPVYYPIEDGVYNKDNEFDFKIKRRESFILNKKY